MNKELIDAMQEPLHPDLNPYVCDTDFGPMLKHPLVTQIIGIVPGFANKQYERKKAMLHKARLNGDLHRQIFLHERPWRTGVLENIWLADRDLAPEILGPLARDVWTDSENIHENLDFWSEFFAETQCSHWSTEDDWRELFEIARFPDERLTVYRGECNDGGWSWTLDWPTAKFFATRGINESANVVTTGRVERRHVMAYLPSRGESEVLVKDRAYVCNQSQENV